MSEKNKPLLEQLEDTLRNLPAAAAALTEAVQIAALELKALREEAIPALLDELKQLRRTWEEAFKPKE